MVLGCWLLLVLGEPGVVHVCPTHAAASAMPVGGAMHHAAHRHDGAPSHQHQGCTCIGCCVGAGAVALIGAAPAATFAVTLVSVVVERTPVTWLGPPPPRYGRPYPTGPPRV